MGKLIFTSTQFSRMIIVQLFEKSNKTGLWLSENLCSRSRHLKRRVQKPNEIAYKYLRTQQRKPSRNQLNHYLWSFVRLLANCSASKINLLFPHDLKLDLFSNDNVQHVVYLKFATWKFSQVGEALRLIGICYLTRWRRTTSNNAMSMSRYHRIEYSWVVSYFAVQ